MVNASVFFPFQLLNPNYIYDGECRFLFLLVLQVVGPGACLRTLKCDLGERVSWGSGLRQELRSRLFVWEALAGVTGAQRASDTDSFLMQFPQNSSFP